MIEHRVALVTGGSRGIGAAIARRLAQSGYTVAVNYRSEQALAESLSEEMGLEAQAFQADLGVPGAGKALVEAVIERYGRLDTLVNNAGITNNGLLIDQDDATWWKALEVNLAGTQACTAAAVPGMMRRRWGRIINLSSIAATKGGRGQTAYSASKGAIEAFTRTLSREVGRKGVLVNAVAPGIIETDMTQETREVAGDKLKELIALQRFGRSEEVAAVVNFLASVEASYVTGQIITVDGGWMA